MLFLNTFLSNEHLKLSNSSIMIFFGPSLSWSFSNITISYSLWQSINGNVQLQYCSSRPLFYPISPYHLQCFFCDGSQLNIWQIMSIFLEPHSWLHVFILNCPMRNERTRRAKSAGRIYQDGTTKAATGPRNKTCQHPPTCLELRWLLKCSYWMACWSSSISGH